VLAFLSADGTGLHIVFNGFDAFIHSASDHLSLAAVSNEIPLKAPNLLTLFAPETNCQDLGRKCRLGAAFGSFRTLWNFNRAWCASWVSAGG
jgi:hypothetical protein